MSDYFTLNLNLLINNPEAFNESFNEELRNVIKGGAIKINAETDINYDIYKKFGRKRKMNLRFGLKLKKSVLFPMIKGNYLPEGYVVLYAESLEKEHLLMPDVMAELNYWRLPGLKEAVINEYKLLGKSSHRKGLAEAICNVCVNEPIKYTDYSFGKKREDNNYFKKNRFLNNSFNKLFEFFNYDKSGKDDCIGLFNLLRLKPTVANVGAVFYNKTKISQQRISSCLNVNINKANSKLLK